MTYEELGSEEYALQQEAAEDAKHALYDEFCSEQLMRIRRLFDKNDDASREGLRQIFKEEEFARLCKYQQEYASLVILMEVYEEEMLHGEPKTILDCGTCCEEMEAIVSEMKYLLLRLEFTGNENNQLFLNYVFEKGLSKYAIARLVCNMNLNQYTMYRKLASLFLDYEKIAYTLVMLTACDGLKPGLEENLMLMAQIYLMAKKTDLAKHCLERITNPSEEVRQLYAKL